MPSLQEPPGKIETRKGGVLSFEPQEYLPQHRDLAAPAFSCLSRYPWMGQEELDRFDPEIKSRGWRKTPILGRICRFAWYGYYQQRHSLYPTSWRTSICPRVPRNRRDGATNAIGTSCGRIGQGTRDWISFHTPGTNGSMSVHRTRSRWWEKQSQGLSRWIPGHAMQALWRKSWLWKILPSKSTSAFFSKLGSKHLQSCHQVPTMSARSPR
mmetsp:Transcript_5836/g.12303  ORF Transcript_5836/g.12303 Transcript_5836/m.12303 type:complete len:211 (-) Transcript_5836:380-1012(-)